MRRFRLGRVGVFLVMSLASRSGQASAFAEITSLTGDFEAKPPAGRVFGRLVVGDRLRPGSRLRTGARSKATLRFGKATQVRIHERSEVVVRPPRAELSQGGRSGLTVFFGRIWARVVRKVAGGHAFEVQSANAVAGVRGTEFQVGVADDGATRVVVTEGRVTVGDDVDSGSVSVSGGYEVESSGNGVLGERRPARDDAVWTGWFSEHARQLEKRGLEVARNLKGRLSRRWRNVQRLVERQRRLRGEIEMLERRGRRGEEVGVELRARTSELEHVTVRLESMQERLRAALGIFDRWGHMAEKGGLRGVKGIGGIVADTRRIAQEFADLVEEGTDLSKEGMEEMLEDMKKGGTLRDR